MRSRMIAAALAVSGSIVLTGCSRSAQHYYESGNKYYADKDYKSAIVQSPQIAPPVVNRGGRSCGPVQKALRGNDNPKPSAFTKASFRVQVT